MTATTPKTETGTRGRILDTAERLVQTRGFNGFSYADVATELGVTKASLHYHFPGKAELGEALVARYT
jgi:TetR/AcrR family transcriptional repressor of nem operon